MFNPDFYPTLDFVTEKMVAPFVSRHGRRRGLNKRTIIDPQAGKGDMLDYLVDNYDFKPEQLFCIEIEPELQAILKSKKYKLIDTDFLAYNDHYTFDLILMNPPFSNGAKHLLHAWEILKHGDIACLLNAETLRNPYTSERKLLLSILEDLSRQGHASVEELGPVFARAERTTSVNVLLVRMHKPRAKESWRLDTSGLDEDNTVLEEEFAANPLAHRSAVTNLVRQHEAARAILIEQQSLESRFRFYTKSIVPAEDRDEEKKLNQKIDELKAHFWQWIFDKTKLGQVTTSNFQAKFKAESDTLSRLSFTEDNIRRVLEMFIENQQEIVQEAILHVFDELTKYYKGNRVHVEGWVSNEAWKCSDHVILPCAVAYEYGSWSIYRQYDKLMDLDKALCFLSGKKIEEIDTVYKVVSLHMEKLNEARYGRCAPVRHDIYLYSTFFKMKFHKKGTLHLYALDSDLWDRFNRTAAMGRGWIGQNDRQYRRQQEKGGDDVQHASGGIHDGQEDPNDSRHRTALVHWHQS